MRYKLFSFWRVALTAGTCAAMLPSYGQQSIPARPQGVTRLGATHQLPKPSTKQISSAAPSNSLRQADASQTSGDERAQQANQRALPTPSQVTKEEFVKAFEESRKNQDWRKTWKPSKTIAADVSRPSTEAIAPKAPTFAPHPHPEAVNLLKPGERERNGNPDRGMMPKNLNALARPAQKEEPARMTNAQRWNLVRED